MKKFETERRVMYYETDAMGVVHHSNYIRMFEEGRTDLMRQIGYPYAEMEKMGIWLPVRAVTCQYKIPAVYDDVLVIRSWVGQLKGVTMTVYYEIVKKETKETVVTGSSSHGFTDTELKPVRLKRDYPEIYERFHSIV